MKEIQSSSNADFRKFLSLTSAKGIKEHHLCILSGKELIREFLKSSRTDHLFAEVLCDSRNLKHSSVSDCRNQFQLSLELFKQLDVVGTDYNLLIVAIPENAEAELNLPAKSSQVLVGMGDPNNLGAALRNCEAFGVKEVVLLKEAANPYLPRAIKASAGSSLRLKLTRGPSIKDLNALQNSEKMLALDMTGTDLRIAKISQPFRLLVGEEGQGIPEKFSGIRLKIPTQSVESLNAAVSLGIALYELQRHQRKE